MRRVVIGLLVAVVAMFGMLAWQTWSMGQQPQPKGAGANEANRLEFEVVESFDAKYPGDTPGHKGRAGGLQIRRPHVALGDPIYRGDQRVGSVTGLTWNRTNGSLDIEFDPHHEVRVCVGDAVWMELDATKAAAAAANPGR